MTKTQIVTVLLTIFYLVWEFVLLKEWKENTQGPQIRIDLLLFYPLIFIGVLISIIQIFRKKNKHKISK